MVLPMLSKYVIDSDNNLLNKTITDRFYGVYTVDLKELGKMVRQLRLEAGIGLRELGRMADISPASLTAIEHGNRSPTLATLHKILKTLGTDFSEFFANSSSKPRTPVFEPKGMVSISDQHRIYKFLLPKRRDVRFEMVDETISPTEVRSEWEVHDCDVGGVILSGGPARLEVEGQGQWILYKGYSFYIKSGLKHRLVNLGKRAIKQITVFDPARY